MNARLGVRVELQRFATIEGFLGAARDFLVDREAEHNLLLGISHTLLTNPGVYPNPPYLAAISADGEIVGVSMQTPPWDLLVSEMDDVRAVDLVVRDRLGEMLPGVAGPVRIAARFADEWSRATGAAADVEMHERVFRLTEVVPPRRATGGMRAARASDRPILYQWLVEFTDEALGGEIPASLDDVADRWANGAGDGRKMQLWIDGGIPVSMTGVGSPTPNGIRIGPVYTPADLRGRGYASNLVAAAAADALDHGRRFCFLFTDLANPTSNHIYEAIGFRPVIDWDRWSFAT